MKAIVMNDIGDTDVMEFVDYREPEVTPGHVLVEIAAAGVNFMDIGVRQGMAWTDQPNPKILGVEGAGRILAVGEGVTDFSVGDRVAWVYAPGSYAERISIPVTSLVSIPDFIDDPTAASIMMQGLTASHFATDFYPVQQGDIALVHAAAGGVGLLLTQIIRLHGGRVIGRVSSKEKVAIAKQAGAEHVIVDIRGDFAQDVLRLTGGKGVDVVYDGSGPTTFQGSLDSLRRSGTFCWYGPVLGGPGLLDIMSLPKSIKIGYAVFSDHIRTPELLRARSRRLFDWTRDGSLTVNVGKSYPLADAALAHADMASRYTTGKLLLVP
ncbi:quinone oxidoreductase family protein [Rhizobium sullae]|uniref:Quinone oxidoreductase n=1 Tax=Rhizobium sullae TaxID=50338 RepID=A0A2N0D1K0_RHISU|nr:quinone oxidoreductase [Rhizobium sullae]PKA40001.1 quinone oxidoreductase [Rhizobium sullae]